ncbi:hypothetical protein BDW22DRAFT_1130125 [Trametopsis cervina]|nr:hypothetical protein BDW22DRAFT_1130125 [Trametopsis cervina]
MSNLHLHHRSIGLPSLISQRPVSSTKYIERCRIFAVRIWAESLPCSIPAQLCRVRPPMLRAAIPVDAVTATHSSDSSYAYFSLAHETTCRRSTDFPVPAGPVKNTFSPRLILAKTISCSSESLTSVDVLVVYIGGLS